MPFTATTSATFNVMVAGTPLDPLVRTLLSSAEVESSMFLPSEFRLVFRGAPLEVIEPSGLQLAVPVEIAVTTGGVPSPLITGEVTGVEVEYGPDGAFTVVRGMDRSHRLMHGTQAMGYEMMTASVVVTELIQDAELEPGPGFIPTSTVYEWLSQANISSWVFIQQLAALENYVAYVDNLGLFVFGPMPSPAEGMPPVASYLEPAMGTQLVMGKNLLRLRASVTGAEQVDSVIVNGYDPKTTLPVVGPGVPLPSTALITELPVEVAGELGGTNPFVDSSHPFDQEGAAIKRAQAIAADIAGALAEMEGQALGNPAILAGKSISIGMAGLPFDGQYVCTSARHVFEPGNGGYTTWFTVGGRRDRSLLSLASGTHPTTPHRPNIGGLVIGTVTNNMDPLEQGRVKVVFPWMSDTYLSAWARVMQIGASKLGAGFLWIPEVDDEVLVGFDRGDIDHPYVIGNLYNGINLPEPPPQVSAGVASRRIVSKTKHTIQFDDGPEAMGITIQSGTQTLLIKMDEEQQAITIQSAGQVTIEAAEAMTIKAGAQLQLQAADISIQGTASVTTQGAETSIQGTSITVAGDASVNVSSPSISLGP